MKHLNLLHYFTLLCIGVAAYIGYYDVAVGFAQDVTPVATATSQPVIEGTAQAAVELVTPDVNITPIQSNEIIVYVLVAALIAAAAMLGVSTPPWTVALLHQSIPSDQRIQATADAHSERVLTDANPKNDWQAAAAQTVGKIIQQATPDNPGVPPMTDTNTVGAVAKDDIKIEGDTDHA